ncbi:hypothetical protein AVEN_184517-1, partial [Araneus ventricosus]
MRGYKFHVLGATYPFYATDSVLCLSVLYLTKYSLTASSFLPGDLMIEAEVLAWLIKQKNEDSIEEVTEEILLSLVRDRGYVLSFF